MITDDRREERRHGIGGSDIGTILGVNDYETKRDLAMRKLGLLPEKEETAPMKRGTRLEPLVAELFTEQTSIEVREEHEMIVHPNYSWMIGNIDRFTMPDLAVLEIKCPGLAVFSKIRREGLPQSWIAQLQWYLAILGGANGIYAVFNSELWKLEHYSVTADPELQALMIGEAEKFWTDLQKGIIPDDESPVIDMPPVGDNKVLKLNTPEFHHLVEELQEAKEIKEEAEALYNAAQDEIKNIMGEYAIVESGGFRAYHTFQNGRITVDGKKLSKEFPEAYAKCKKQGTPFKSFRPYWIGEKNER